MKRERESKSKRKTEKKKRWEMGKDKVIKVGMTEQVRKEISVMKMVEHPNIVELHEVMANKSKIYFAMKLVRGGELFSKISKGRLKEDVARVYFQQPISAVDFCHRRGVYHRDLKPENLLLDESGNLKVTDFRLSALAEHLKHDGFFFSDLCISRKLDLFILLSIDVAIFTLI